MRRGLFIAIALLLLAVSDPAHAADDVSVKASLDGQDLDQNDPIRFEPDQPLKVDVAITNGSDEEITVESVRIDGDVLNLTFFSYEARIGVPVAPGETEERSLVIDLVGLKGQAKGQIPARLTLLDQDRTTIATNAFTADVRGSFWSIYGIFGVAIAAITILILVGALVRLAMGTLPANRWSRAARFGVAGLGLGLTVTIALSAFRVLTPHPTSSLSLLIGCGVVLFVLGYLTPTPMTADEDMHADIPISENQGVLDLREAVRPAWDDTAPTAVVPAAEPLGVSTMARTGAVPAPWSDDPSSDHDHHEPENTGLTEDSPPRGTIIRRDPLPPPDEN